MPLVNTRFQGVWNSPFKANKENQHSVLKDDKSTPADCGAAAKQEVLECVGF